MTLFLRLALAAALIFGVPLEAFAAAAVWVQGSLTASYTPDTSTSWSSDLVTASTNAAAAIDTRDCDKVGVSFDASITDNDTTARGFFSFCPTSTYTGSCIGIQDSANIDSNTGPEFSTIYAVPAGKYTFFDLKAAVAANKTARATVTCIKRKSSAAPLGSGRGILPASAKGVTSPSGVVDLFAMFSSAPNDKWDADDASMYGLTIAVPSGTDDFISPAQELANRCLSTECVMKLTQATASVFGGGNTLSLPSDVRYLVCRGATGPNYTPCSGTGGGVGTCTSTFAATDHVRAYPIVMYRPGSGVHVVHSIVAATSAACQGTGEFSVTVTPNVPTGGYTTDDYVGPFYISNIHYSKLGSEAIADYIATATVESTRIARTAELPGLAAGIGTMETDCAASGYTRTGTGTLAQTVAATASYINSQNRQSVWGNGCGLTGGSIAATDYIQTPAWTTVAGRVYVVRLWERDVPGATIYTGHTITNSADVYHHVYGPQDNRMNLLPGWMAIPATVFNGCDNWHFDGTWRLCIMKYRATSTSSQLRLAASATAQSIFIDELTVFPADNGNPAELQPLFDSGLVSATIDGDSQVQDKPVGNTAATGGLGTAFYNALLKLPGVTPAFSIDDMQRGVSGSTIEHLGSIAIPGDAAQQFGLQRYRLRRPAVAVGQSYINDIVKTGNIAWPSAAPATPDTAKATEVIVGVIGSMGGYSGLPLWTTPQPHAYNTGTAVSVCGAYNCGVTSNKIVTAVLHSGRLGW